MTANSGSAIKSLQKFMSKIHDINESNLFAEQKLPLLIPKTKWKIRKVADIAKRN